MKTLLESLRPAFPTLALALSLLGVAGAQPPSRSYFVASRERELGQAFARYHSLMAEGRYQDAESLAAATRPTQPDLAATRCAELRSRMMEATTTMNTIRDLRHRGYVDSMTQVELSHVPVPDEPPIFYPNPDAWQLLTRRRNRYQTADVASRSPNERKILAALDEKADIDFAMRPLTDVVDYLKQLHGIEIQIDKPALAAAGVDPAATITRNVKGITLRSALRLLLRDLDLTFVVCRDMLLITSQSEAARMLTTRVYPVADLLNRNWGWTARRMGLGGSAGMRPVVIGNGVF